MITPTEAFHICLLHCNMCNNIHTHLLQKFVKAHLRKYVQDDIYRRKYAYKMRLFKKMRNEMIYKSIQLETQEEPDSFIAYGEYIENDDKFCDNDKICFGNGKFSPFSYTKMIHPSAMIYWDMNNILLRMQAITVALLEGVDINMQLESKYIRSFVNNYDVFNQKRAIHAALDIGNIQTVEYMVQYLIANGCIVHRLSTDFYDPLVYAEYAEGDSITTSNVYTQIQDKALREHMAAYKIAKCWFRSITNPTYTICKSRLTLEYSSMFLG